MGGEKKKKKKKKAEEEKPEEPKQEEPKPEPVSKENKFWSIILSALSFMLVLLVFVKGSKGWLSMHNMVRGTFGASSLFVAIIVGYIAYKIEKDKKQELIFSRIIQGGLLAVSVSSLMQILFFGDVEGETFNDQIKYLYNSGIRLKSGGVLSSLIGMPLMSILGITGARITIIFVIILMIMLFTDYTPEKLIGKLKKNCTMLKKSLYTIRETSATKRYYKEVKNTEKYEIEDDSQKPLKIEEKKKNSNLKREVKFDDIKKLFNKEKKSSEELNKNIEEILNEKSESLSLKFVTTNTIDIPLVTEEMNNEYKAEKEKLKPVENSTPEVNKVNNLPAEEEKNEGHIINLDKKNDFVDIPSDGKYNYPPIKFLKPGNSLASSATAEAEKTETAEKLVQTLESFGVKTSLGDIHRGPTVTRYELQPLPGVKISRITGLSDDIALNLAAAGVRIEAPIPGKAAVGIEVPNAVKDTVSLREMLESDEFKNSPSKLSFAVGRDIAGKVIIGDIAKMPHVIIAGSTGSGKSVCTNSIIMSILYKATPDQVRLLLIDPKIVEFKVYDGIPHLLIPVVTDPRKAAGALNWAVQEMLRRYKLFADNNVRDLKGYNELASESEGRLEAIPQIVIAIDELADLMMAASNEVEDAICRLAQMARAAGMHLIIATQRPTVDIITGLIKANIPSRIALSVMSQTDSRTILDTGGADKLLGQGDMLYFPSGIPKPIRVQGCFCSTKEIESVVNFIKNNEKVEYSDEIMEEIEKNIPVAKGEKSSGKIDGAIDGDDELVEKAIDIIVETGQASTSSLQRKLKLGYARAARIMDELEQLGVIGPSEGSKPRKILMSKAQWTERKMRRFEDGESEE